LREHLEESESQEAHWWSWLGDIHFRGADGKGAISAYERASVSEAPSSLLLSSWARASLLTPNPTDLENWFERCAPHWTEEPQLRTLAFWIARWHRRGSLARRAVLEGSHRDLDLWAEALQLWPDDPEVTERYAADLALRDGPASAALVLAELTPRLLDPADRARVGLLSAEYAASAGWSAWEVAMYDYVSGQTPELDFSHDVTDSTAHPAPEEPSELMSDSRDSIEMIAYQLDPTAPDPEALEALAAYAKGELGNAERVADALERAARRASDGRLQAKLYQSLAELSLDRLEQPRRALWALERAGHTGGAALSRQAHVEARATEAMQKRPGNERQLAALQRRSPDDYPEAIAYYEAAVKSDPNDTVAYRSLERLYRILGDDERADSMLDRQVHVASSDVERRALERRVHARRALSRAAKHTKRNPDAHAATLLPPGKDALRYGQRRTHDESTPPHAAAALGAIKALHEAPSANAYLAFAARFGGSTGLFRAALQLAYADQAEPDAQAVIGAWCDRHVHDLGAYRQQLRDALDRALPEAMIRAAEELLALPLLHHTVPELQECWEQSAAARRTIEGALVERLGLHFPLALDGCARREWSLFTADQASRESTLLELYHRYLADADMEHAAWALQRLSATPE
jgi:tetratricopeptide (TPR) repeat protein